MAKPATREQSIRRGQLIHKVGAMMHKFQALVSKKDSAGEVVFIETDFGSVRTLWYGFQKEEKLPVYFDLHGGGFMMGTADMDEAMNLVLSEQVGCKIVSVQYAKAPQFPYPTAVNQVYAVAKHVFENAEHYAIQPGKMAIGGHSAGGNLSAVACMKAKKEGLFQFACQILDYPPLDLATDPVEKPQPKGAITPEMAAMFNACYVDPAQAKDPYVSPVFAAPEDLVGLPPALFILAGMDSLHDEGLKYRHMLEAAGVTTECYEYPHAPHGFTYQASPDTTDALEKMAAFLKKYLM